MTSPVKTATTLGASSELLARYRRLYRPTDDRPNRRLPHPGDVLYWVGCIGAISFLLLVATR